MKQRYLFFLLLIGQLALAQDLRLYENTWYLSQLTQNGADYFPPSNEEVQNVPLYFTQNIEGTAMASNVCNTVFGVAEFDDAESLWYRDYAVTLMMCNSMNNNSFEAQYFHFFTGNYPNDTFTYTITEANQVLSLVLTSQNGDQAFYSNQLLATRQFAQSNFSIQPNPASDYIELKSDNTAYNNATVEVYNALGAKCKSEKLRSALHHMNVADLSAGWYVITVKSETETFTGKFLKK
ncbi:T9SS type A sorting domain-containing protein [Flavobacterium sp.]|uniref:T9SS type A sorting domain-containing protein n=1 Tax=Flavobacterium sp. TaxID=239 RepID=UPI0039E43339